MSDRESEWAASGPRRWTRRWLAAVYLVNATLVLCHEIDSARWAEWDLFHLPGGAPVFVALHLLVVPLLFLGAAQIAGERPGARWTVLVVGLAGGLGALVHTGFLVAGDGRFHTPFSIGLIAAFGLSSVVLTALDGVAWRALAARSGA